jgi:hypothetical protein
MYQVLLLLVILSACNKNELNPQREEEFREDETREKDSYKRSVPIKDQDLDL